MTNLSDAQWCFLDLLARAKQKGVSRISRLELLDAAPIADEAKLKLVWAGLTMPREFVVMHGAHDFEITDAGEQALRLRFGHGPTEVADFIIALPDQSKPLS